MQLANQASALHQCHQSSKYGHFWLQKNKMATAKMQTGGFTTAEHKPEGDVTDSTSIIYTDKCVKHVKEHRGLWISAQTLLSL